MISIPHYLLNANNSSCLAPCEYSFTLLLVVLDAHVEKGRGVVAEVLVKWGQISIGDCVVIGSSYGKVRGIA